MKLVAVYAACWPGMVVLAIVNGTLREKLYRPRMSELSAHQVSTVLLMALLGIYLWVLTGFFHIGSAGQGLVIGFLWLGLTVAFEFFFGHFVMKHSWAQLLHDYNLARGRLWPLLLAWTVAAPCLFFWIRN